MRCQKETELGRLLREARKRHGLSQRRLALRAGTSQDAISRIERGVESPAFGRFQELLLAMGETPVVRVEPLEPVVDPGGLAAAQALSTRERLLESASWNLVATKLEVAAARAKKTGHPSTRRSAR